MTLAPHPNVRGLFSGAAIDRLNGMRNASGADHRLIDWLSAAGKPRKQGIHVISSLRTSAKDGDSSQGTCTVVVTSRGSPRVDRTVNTKQSWGDLCQADSIRIGDSTLHSIHRSWLQSPAFIGFFSPAVDTYTPQEEAGRRISVVRADTCIPVAEAGRRTSGVAVGIGNRRAASDGEPSAEAAGSRLLGVEEEHTESAPGMCTSAAGEGRRSMTLFQQLPVKNPKNMNKSCAKLDP